MGPTALDVVSVNVELYFEGFRICAGARLSIADSTPASPTVSQRLGTGSDPHLDDLLSGFAL